ncbi:MAG: inorganic phosphate transporter [Prevotellaceae bacterium]|jgi:PiT family inorganic phosphate transporter|nr:inorganic phosphate transporter [Prevotellaceae bacterium]
MALLVTIILVALIFDFINGFHDAANSVATVVSSKVLSPTQAVLWAAFFNFVAYFIAKLVFGDFGIADTVSKTVDLTLVDNPSLVIIAGLMAAIAWNLLTWRLGIPSSSSHTLIGGFMGAGIAAYGFAAIRGHVLALVVMFIVLAPLIGMVAGNIITLLTMHLARRAHPTKADRWFRGLQLCSSAALSIGHGLNDSQKVMGIIAAAMIAAPQADLPTWMRMSSMHDMHDWIPICCFSAISLGTMCGGWKIMKTMGNRITKITLLEGFCAQLAGAITLFVTEHVHAPASTTHVITGSIIGVGSIKRLTAVRWGVTVSLLWAWLLTIPVSAGLAMGCYYLLRWMV